MNLKHSQGNVRKWHGGCKNVTVAPKVGGVGFAFVCLDCRSWIDAEAVTEYEEPSVNAQRNLCDAAKAGGAS